MLNHIFEMGQRCGAWNPSYKRRIRLWSSRLLGDNPRNEEYSLGQLRAGRDEFNVPSSWHSALAYKKGRRALAAHARAPGYLVGHHATHASLMTEAAQTTEFSSTVLQAKACLPSPEKLGEPEQMERDGLEALVSLAALTELADEARAEAAYREAIAAEPSIVNAYGALATLLCRQGREDEALDVINAALDNCDSSAKLHYFRGYALESAGRLAAAIEAFGRALALDRTLAEPHYRLGLLCARLGDPVTSARHLARYERLIVARNRTGQLN